MRRMVRETSNAVQNAVRLSVEYAEAAKMRDGDGKGKE